VGKVGGEGKRQDDVLQWGAERQTFEKDREGRTFRGNEGKTKNETGKRGVKGPWGEVGKL